MTIAKRALSLLVIAPTTLQQGDHPSNLYCRIALSWSFSGLAAMTPTMKTAENNQVLLSQGDACGAALLVEGVSVLQGSAQILQEDMDWRVEPKSKEWAIVGTNGAGKSTLVLKAIMEELVYQGKIPIGTAQTVGYLQQTAVAGSTNTIMDKAALAMQAIATAGRHWKGLKTTMVASDACTHISAIVRDKSTGGHPNLWIGPV